MLNTERMIHWEKRYICGILFETTSVNNPFGGNECGFNNADEGKTMKLEITSWLMPFLQAPLCLPWNTLHLSLRHRKVSSIFPPRSLFLLSCRQKLESPPKVTSSRYSNLHWKSLTARHKKEQIISSKVMQETWRIVRDLFQAMISSLKLLPRSNLKWGELASVATYIRQFNLDQTNKANWGEKEKFHHQVTTCKSVVRFGIKVRYHANVEKI